MNTITIFSLRTQCNNDERSLMDKEVARIDSLIKQSLFEKQQDIYCLRVADETQRVHGVVLELESGHVVFKITRPLETCLFFKLRTTLLSSSKDLQFAVYMAINRSNLLSKDVVVKIDESLPLDIEKKLNHIKAMRALSEKRCF